MTTPEPFPTGFKCETCGKFHEFGKYVAAHWRTILKHKCDRCDAEHTVICGSAKLRKRGVIPTCGTCSLWRIDDAKDKAGRVRRDRHARCDWKSTEVWPASVQTLFHKRPVPHFMGYKEGENCPCHQKRSPAPKGDKS